MSNDRWSFLKEEGGKVSMARVQLAASLSAFFVVFSLWVVIMLGLFLDLWPWTRFEGAVVAGGIGLLSVVFGGVGAYAVNKVSDRWG